jgi:hypothetical protein
MSTYNYNSVTENLPHQKGITAQEQEGEYIQVRSWVAQTPRRTLRFHDLDRRAPHLGKKRWKFFRVNDFEDTRSELLS